MTSLDPSSNALALRHFPAEEKETQSLPELLGRLYEQRGHFRKVTEEGLKKEIEAQKSEEDSPSDEALSKEAGAKDLEGKETTDDIYATKVEMIAAIAQAQNEALLALDFISLLLSKDAPRQAQQSMSQALTELVPAGTLAYDKWPSEGRSQVEKQKEDVVMQGWKITSVNESAESLLKASARLQTGVQQEKTYWDELLAIARRGYAIARVHPQRQRHVFGAQVGFIDAAPNFKERGFAILNRSNEGRISLDAALSRSPRTIRVRIVDDGKTVGTSMLPSISEATEPAIDELVDRARSSLFEEELFHEMCMEVRVLQSYDASLRGTTIHLPLQGEVAGSGEAHSSKRTILLDLVSREERKLSSDDTSADRLAHSVAVSLRILLCFAYRQKLRRRSHPPPPLSDRKRPTPPHAILRPLLNHFQHFAMVDRLRAYLDHAFAILKSARLSTGAQVTSDWKILKSTDESPRANSASSIVESMINNLSSPLSTIFSLALPSSANTPEPQRIPLTVRTHFSPPVFGTEFIVELPPSITALLGLEIAASASKRFTFQSFDELRDYLNSLVAIDLIHGFIVSRHDHWVGERGVAEAVKTTDDGAIDVISVDLDDQRLSFRRSGEGQEGVVEHVWDGAGARDSFEDVVTRVLDGSRAKEANVDS